MILPTFQGQQTPVFQGAVPVFQGPQMPTFQGLAPVGNLDYPEFKGMVQISSLLKISADKPSPGRIQWLDDPKGEKAVVLFPPRLLDGATGKIVVAALATLAGVFIGFKLAKR